MIKYTGIIRQIDNNGRLVLPKEIRRVLGIEDGNDSVEIFINDAQEVILRKYEPCCTFCNSMYDLVRINDRLVCKKCIDRLNQLETKRTPTDFM